MAVDKSGKWWVGSEPDDIRDYLVAYKCEGYNVDETRVCKCACGSMAFRLEADRAEGGARRTCTACGAPHLICDSAEYWKYAKPQPWKCTECGSDICNLGVGFSLYEPEGGNPPDVRWVSVGERCVGCGVLGSFVDWKVAYGPTSDLLEQA